MSAATVFQTLAARGAVVTVRGDILSITPRAVIDEPLRAEIRAHKSELLELLSAPQKAPAGTYSADLPTAPRTATARPPRQPSAERLRLASEIGGILQVLAGAKRLKNGDWKINGELYDHDNAVLLAAQTRGTTTNGYPLSFDAGAAYRAAIDESATEAVAADKPTAPQVLAG